MSIKVKQSLLRCFDKIEDETFDEDTIRTLLIGSRDYIKGSSLIKELAHFIAHPIRNQGMFHKKLNARYAKLKLVDEQVSRFKMSEILERIKTEDELSDFMLGGISVEKIESKLFEILYYDGLEDLPESHLQQYTGLNKNEVRNLFKQYYNKREGYYYLTTNKTENLLRTIKNQTTDKYDPEIDIDAANKLANAEDLIKKIKSRIDGIQKVVRGAIYYNSVFDTATLRQEIEIAILDIVNHFNIDIRFVEIVKNKIDDILLCIMALLHDSKFVFYDKNIARAFLCLYTEWNSKPADDKLSEKDNMFQKGVLALYITYKSGEKTTSIPLFVSKLAMKKYISKDSYMTTPSDLFKSEIKWIVANRVGKNLQLIDTN
jgi:hypothetical protein